MVTVTWSSRITLQPILCGRLAEGPPDPRGGLSLALLRLNHLQRSPSQSLGTTGAPHPSTFLCAALINRLRIRAPSPAVPSRRLSVIPGTVEDVEEVAPTRGRFPPPLLGQALSKDARYV